METIVMNPTLSSIAIERNRRLLKCQSGRLRLGLTLIAMSLVEWTVVCMSYYMEVPLWLVILNCTCIIFNFPLILWLGTLYFEHRKKEKEIKKQAFNTYKNR